MYKIQTLNKISAIGLEDFPRDDYERLIEAHERADAVAVELAGKALEARIRAAAKEARDLQMGITSEAPASPASNGKHAPVEVG